MSGISRSLGRFDADVSPMGLGCWAIGGPFWLGDKADGWGRVDDDESIRAIQAAVDQGVNFFDTADVYGTGHSETVLGRALAGRRQHAVIATKFGFTYDESARRITGTDVRPGYIRRACEASLKRLGTDYIDLYQLHCGASPGETEAILDTLERLREEGLIRAYGVSTDDPALARSFAAAPHCVAVQHELNVLNDARAMLDVCAEQELVSINRTPLAFGLLSGKYTAASSLPSDDFRSAGHDWVRFFEDGRPRPEFLEALEAVREILTSGGRTLPQGALAWIWGKSDRTIPIPGFKTVDQVRENCRAMEHGPLDAEAVWEIDRLLEREVGAG